MGRGFGCWVMGSVLALGALSGCGSDDSKSSGSTKRLDALTPAEVAAYCDSVAAKLGGYGKSKDCSGGVTLDAPANQAECIAEYTFTNCAVTVDEANKCIAEQSCTNLIPASCAGVFSCM
ncbi:MAG: hypothetical protein QM756_09795 [Polyangiaceae bacterium]